MSTYEYGFNVWGGYFQSNAARDAGYRNGTYFFSDKKSRDSYLKEMSMAAARCGEICVSDLFEGEAARERTIACMTLIVGDACYPMEYDFGYGSYGHADYMFKEGNYACDCNRSMFIRQLYGNVPGLPPESECGEKIGMKDFTIRYERGPLGNYLPPRDNTVSKPKENRQ